MERKKATKEEVREILEVFKNILNVTREKEDNSAIVMTALGYVINHYIGRTADVDMAFKSFVVLLNDQVEEGACPCRHLLVRDGKLILKERRNDTH